MNIKLVFSFCLFLLFSCSEKENDKKIYIITEPSWKKEKKIDSTYLKITTTDQKNIYHYGHSLYDTLISNYFYIEKTIGNDKFLRVYNEDCKLVDTLSFSFNDKKTKVYKYLYNEENVEDDMIDYYFNDELGVIFARDLSWNINFFYNPKDLKPLQDSIINNLDKFKSSFKLNTTTETETKN